MLTRSERRLTDAEREQLEQALLRVDEHIKDAVLKNALIVFLDVVSVFLGVVACVNGDRSGPAGICAGVGAIVVANIVLVLSWRQLGQSRCMRARLRRAKLDDTAVVDRIEASGAARLRGDKMYSWYIFSVDEKRLVAMPRDSLSDGSPTGVEAGNGLRVCFDRIYTKEGRLHLATVSGGDGALPLPPVIELWKLIPDRATRQRVVARLDTTADFPGRLDKLAESLCVGRLNASGMRELAGALRAQMSHPTTSSITCPCTSVSRKSRPPKRYVNRS
jgi:hypothetical protein